MDDKEEKKKQLPIIVGGKTYSQEPSMLDRLKEGFDTQQDRAQVEAIRKRRQKMGT